MRCTRDPENGSDTKLYRHKTGCPKALLRPEPLPSRTTNPVPSGFFIFLINSINKLNYCSLAVPPGLPLLPAACPVSSIAAGGIPKGPWRHPRPAGEPLQYKIVPSGRRIRSQKTEQFHINQININMVRSMHLCGHPRRSTPIRGGSSK